MRKFVYLAILIFFIAVNAVVWTFTYQAATAPSPETLQLAAAAPTPAPPSPVRLVGDGLDEQVSLTGLCSICAGPWRYFQTGNELADPYASGTPYFALDYDATAWPTMDLPQNWYLAGLNYQGVVWFRQEFTPDPTWLTRGVQLRFDGIDYYADIWLNGQKLGNHVGYFDPIVFDLAGKLVEGKNVLAVRVNSPWEEYDAVWPHHKVLIKGILTQHDSRPGGAWTLPGQAYNTGGIWAPITLEVSDALRVQGAQVQATWPTTITVATISGAAITGAAANVGGVDGAGPTLPQAPDASVQAAVTLRNFADAPVRGTLQVQLVPRNFSGPTLTLPEQAVRLPRGDTTLTITGSVPQPVLWQPWDRGDPNLYTVRVTVSAEGKPLATYATAFGFRQVLVGPNWDWTVNGQPYFVRGSSYFSSQWLAQTDAAQVNRDLRLARAANLNLLRVYAHVEPPDFYRTADELGLLVWQDFPLNWGYSDAPAFVDEAQRQLAAMITQLFNHPSIVLWCMHNDSPWQSPQAGQRMSDYDRRQNKRLDEVLSAQATELDPTRFVLINSGGSDKHIYAGWDTGAWTDYAEVPGAPFISEYGAQALPNFGAMVRMLPPDHLTYRDGETRTRWEFHDFLARPTFDVAKIDPGDSTTQFVSNSQAYQANLLQFATESYRRARFSQVMGIIQYSLVDAWPAITWSVLDVERQPKAGYEALQTAMQPVLPSIAAPVPDHLDGRRWVYVGGNDLAINLWVINDLLTSFPQATLRWRFERSGGGATPPEGSQVMDIEPNQGKPWALLAQLGLEPGDYDLHVTVADSTGQVLGVNLFQLRIEPEPSVTPTAESAGG